jgi:hypothetical protein
MPDIPEKHINQLVRFATWLGIKDPKSKIGWHLASSYD